MPQRNETLKLADDAKAAASKAWHRQQIPDISPCACWLAAVFRLGYSASNTQSANSPRMFGPGTNRKNRHTQKKKKKKTAHHS